MDNHELLSVELKEQIFGFLEYLESNNMELNEEGDIVYKDSEKLVINNE